MRCGVEENLGGIPTRIVTPGDFWRTSALRDRVQVSLWSMARHPAVSYGLIRAGLIRFPTAAIGSGAFGSLLPSVSSFSIGKVHVSQWAITRRDPTSGARLTRVPRRSVFDVSTGYADPVVRLSTYLVLLGAMRLSVRTDGQVQCHDDGSTQIRDFLGPQNEHAASNAIRVLDNLFAAFVHFGCPIVGERGSVCTLSARYDDVSVEIETGFGVDDNWWVDGGLTNS